MFRIALAFFAIGGAMGFFGYQEYQVGAGASSTAVSCELLDLEKGTEPPDKHLEIGSHWAIFPTWVGWGDQDSDGLDYIYYPMKEKYGEWHGFDQMILFSMVRGLVGNSLGY